MYDNCCWSITVKQWLFVCMQVNYKVVLPELRRRTAGVWHNKSAQFWASGGLVVWGPAAYWATAGSVCDHWPQSRPRYRTCCDGKGGSTLCWISWGAVSWNVGENWPECWRDISDGDTWHISHAGEWPCLYGGWMGWYQSRLCTSAW